MIQYSHFIESIDRLIAKYGNRFVYPYNCPFCFNYKCVDETSLRNGANCPNLAFDNCGVRGDNYYLSYEEIMDYDNLVKFWTSVKTEINNLDPNADYDFDVVKEIMLECAEPYKKI
jgi:hypothetical protein